MASVTARRGWPYDPTFSPRPGRRSSISCSDLSLRCSWTGGAGSRDARHNRQARLTAGDGCGSFPSEEQGDAVKGFLLRQHRSKAGCRSGGNHGRSWQLTLAFDRFRVRCPAGRLRLIAAAGAPGKKQTEKKKKKEKKKRKTSKKKQPKKKKKTQGEGGGGGGGTAISAVCAESLTASHRHSRLHVSEKKQKKLTAR